MWLGILKDNPLEHVGIDHLTMKSDTFAMGREIVYAQRSENCVCRYAAHAASRHRACRSDHCKSLLSIEKATFDNASQHMV